MDSYNNFNGQYSTTTTTNENDTVPRNFEDSMQSQMLDMSLTIAADINAHLIPRSQCFNEIFYDLETSINFNQSQRPISYFHNLPHQNSLSPNCISFPSSNDTSSSSSPYSTQQSTQYLLPQGRVYIPATHDSMIPSGGNNHNWKHYLRSPNSSAVEESPSPCNHGETPQSTTPSSSKVIQRGRPRKAVNGDEDRTTIRKRDYARNYSQQKTEDYKRMSDCLENLCMKLCEMGMEPTELIPQYKDVLHPIMASLTSSLPMT